MALTAAAMVTLVCQICKAPGMVVQAGQFLNQTLEDLVLHRDLKVNRVLTSVTFGAGTYGPFPLEPQYLRTYDLFYLENGLPYFLNPISLKEFDREFQAAGLANYPYEFATDLSVEAQTLSGGAGWLYVYPESSGQITANHRYMINRPDLLTPETSTVIPWFSDQNYLIEATAARLMAITDDERRPQFMGNAERMLGIHTIMEGDEQAVVHRVELDPRTFNVRRRLKATKITD